MSKEKKITKYHTSNSRKQIIGIQKNQFLWRSMVSKVKQETMHKTWDSMNEWRGSCEMKMNDLEFSQLLTDLKKISEI